jgi:hypothetical protein
VVRDLQHVGTQVDARRQDPGLGLRAEVAREEDPQAPIGDPGDHRQVVGFGARGRPVGCRGEHLDLRPVDRAAITWHEDRAPRADAADQGLERGHAVVGRGQGAGGHDPDVPPRQRPGQAAGMVGVEVGQQDQR